MALLPGEAPSLDETAQAGRQEGAAGHVEPIGPTALAAGHLAWWCLQFTPRVARLEEAVVIEIQASERLFGGRRVLRQRIAREAAALGIRAWAHAGTALGALALARQALQCREAEEQARRHAAEDVRHAKAAVKGTAKGAPQKAPQETPAASAATFAAAGIDVADDDAGDPGDDPGDGPAPSGLVDGLGRLGMRLDELPLHVLPGVAEHQPTLARLGCQTLREARHLPRGGLSRRFGARLLQALDQAYGLTPETFDWVTLPPAFDARLELPGRVETAPALLFAAQRLLQQLCAWLAGRQAGVTAFTLRWLHDWHRREDSREGRWTVRMASPTRDPRRLSRLLDEHLQRIELAAPVCDISLHADEIESLPICSQALFQEHAEDRLSAAPDALITPAAQRAQRDALLALLDRLSVRLGADRVQVARIQADHRLECMQTWWPAVQALQQQPAWPAASQGKPSRLAPRVANMPQPAWVLAEPLHLALASDGSGLREHPLYQGRLILLAGPHRIEAGWWDVRAGHALVTRDYYVASSEKAGLLWIFRERHLPEDRRSPWFLHGFFA